MLYIKYGKFCGHYLPRLPRFKESALSNFGVPTFYLSDAFLRYFFLLQLKLCEIKQLMCHFIISRSHSAVIYFHTVQWEKYTRPLEDLLTVHSLHFFYSNMNN